LPQDTAAHLLEPFNLTSGKVPRYYQQIAIQRVIEAILLGPEAHPRHAGHRHGQDQCGLPDLLEAVEQPLEPHRVNTAAPRSCSWPTAISWSMTRWPRCSRPSAMPGTRSAGGDTSQSRDMYFGIYQALDHHQPTCSASTARTSST
jgi:type I restriction enzyme R subunit